jgi:type VI secretion system ImpH/TssG family protein
MKERLTSELAARAARIGFFELVRLLEHALAERVGEVGAAEPERIAFSHSPSLAFPASDVASLGIERRSATVRTTFVGLLGTASPLTPEWTEEVLYDDEDGALQAFYDVIHARALSLLYVAWKEHALEGGFDLRGEDALSRRLRSLAGIDGWADALGDPLPPMAAVGLADYQRGQPQTIDLRSAEGLLRRIYPDWNVRLQGGVERFVPFATSERALLGVARNRLGEGLVYGDGCAESEGLVRLVVGPVDLATGESLMPGGARYAQLQRLARQLLASAVHVEIEVELAPGEAPCCVLGELAGSRLGVDSRYSTDADAAVHMRAPLLADARSAERTILG